jgi:uncharacterized SAM-binding protein YcdF (DUF218 family)
MPEIDMARLLRQRKQNPSQSGVSAPVRALTAWRRWLLRLFLAGMVLSLLIVGALAVVILRYGSVDRARPADVIIVLGGGVDGTTRRTLHAAALYAQGYAPYLLCSGATVPGEPITEAERCGQVAQAHGVPPNAIVLDEISGSTEENAIQSAAIMHARGWRDAVLVSDDTHLWRAHWLFERKGLRVWTSPAQVTSGPQTRAETLRALFHEMAGTGWYVGKSLLGLPYTRFGS